MTPKLLSCYLFFTCLFLSVFSNASMAQAPVGGDISYELYSTTSYIVKLRLFQTEEQDTINRPVKVFLNSSCYNDTLEMHSYIPLGGKEDMWGGSGSSRNCNDTVFIDGKSIDVFYYQDTVQLLVTCSDYKFSYYECCRDSAIDNIAQPENTGMYLEARLNNTLGQNTSPIFYSLPGLRFYSGATSYLSGMYVTEPNADSIHYSLVSAKDSTGANVLYNSGYNALQPYPTQVSFQNGISPTQAGRFTVVIEATEYRVDPSMGWYQVGSSQREVIYFVEDSIPQGVMSTAFGGPNMIDTLKSIYCKDSIISLPINDFWVGSLTQDGSEFRIIGSDSVVRPIVETGFYNVKPDLSCDSIWLKLHRPLSKNDTVFILLKKGNDGNSLVNLCGLEFPTLDTGVLIIQDCQYTGGDEYNTPQFSLYPNPSKDKVMLEFEAGEAPESITIYNLQGKELRHEIKPSLKTELDISTFPKGMYLIKVRSGNNFSTQLFQKD